MIESPGWAFMVLSFFLVIGPLIFVHELGHYFVGRWFGVRADAFSIGFGREIAGWTDRRGTRWKVGWLPLGGYVKFAGDMNPASTPSSEWLMLPPEERAKTFQSKPLWQRFLIVAAGPITNFLAAILIYMGIFAAVGHPSSAPVVGTVAPGSPAAQIGLAPGDEILRIDGRSMRSFVDVRQYVLLRPGQPIELDIRRGSDRFSVGTVTAAEEQTDEFGNRARVGRLGVMPAELTIEPVPAMELPIRAVEQTGDVLGMIVVSMKQLLLGQRSVRELGGPLKIAQVSGQQATLGWLHLMWFMAMISINLGFINLLPIPLLDGGHLMFYAIEGVRRRPLRPEAQEWAFKAGLAALLTLMIFVTLNDLTGFGFWSRVGGLIG